MNNNYQMVAGFLRLLIEKLGEQFAKIDDKAFTIYQHDEEFDLSLVEGHAATYTIDGESNFKYYYSGDYDASDLHVVVKVFSQAKLSLLHLLVDNFIIKPLQNPKIQLSLSSNDKAKVQVTDVDEVNTDKLSYYGISKEVYDLLDKEVKEAIMRNYEAHVTLKQHAITTETRANGDNAVTLMLGLGVKNITM